VIVVASSPAPLSFAWDAGIPKSQGMVRPPPGTSALTVLVQAKIAAYPAKPHDDNAVLHFYQADDALFSTSIRHFARGSVPLAQGATAIHADGRRPW